MNKHARDISLEKAKQWDATDPLRHLRAQFALPQGVCYLDGNSLGALPRATAERVAHTVAYEWGERLIGSWNEAAWIELPTRVGDGIGQLIGANPGETVACDSTSVNLYKALFAIISIAALAQSTAQNGNLAHKNANARKTVLSERSNFPTDLYMAQSLCGQHGLELKLVHESELEAAITPDVAALMLTHVHYRSGRMHNMAALTAKAHAVGALTLWDLAHSAGAVPVDLHAANADFAVGCGYKYLNGGPGAPAFVWMHPRHAAAARQPLTGWLGHAAPFAFTPEYAGAPGVKSFVCGTPPVLSMVALGEGVRSVLAAGPTGEQAMERLRAKSLALTDFFLELVDGFAPEFGIWSVTPRSHSERGSQVSLHFAADRPERAHAVMQAMIARQVVGDFRAGDPTATHAEDRVDLLRFGFTPAYVGFEDVRRAAQTLFDVLHSGAWRASEFAQTRAVT